MKEVNLYLYTNTKGCRIRPGSFCYILEMPTKKGPVTLTEVGNFEAMTPHCAQLHVLAAALRRIREQCKLVIYTDSAYLTVNAMESLEMWKKNGWKTSKHKAVRNVEEWKAVYQLLKPHHFRFERCAAHSYYHWMQKETEDKAQCTLPGS